MNTTPIYRISVAGILDPSWSDWFNGLLVSYEDQEVTVLTGQLKDQAALHGVLNKIRDLGMTLLEVSVQAAGPDKLDDAS